MQKALKGIHLNIIRLKPSGYYVYHQV